MVDRGKKKIIFTILFVLLMLVEVVIALYVHDSFIRPYMGDVLVVVVLYAGIRIIVPEKFRLLPLYVFIFASMFEVLQYFNIVDVIGLSNNRFMRVLIGSVFDIRDVICYGVGCILIGICQWIVHLNRRKKTTNEDVG